MERGNDHLHQYCAPSKLAGYRPGSLQCKGTVQMQLYVTSTAEPLTQSLVIHVCHILHSQTAYFKLICLTQITTGQLNIIFRLLAALIQLYVSVPHDVRLAWLVLIV